MWIVGTDTGGTFTDLVAISDAGEVVVAKTPSTPPEFQHGVVNALRESGIPIDQVRALHHGTTVTTNALLTRTGSHTALITTEGFRDVLELRDGSRGEYYNINWDPPAPLVARPDRIPVRERVNYAGSEIEPLDEDGVREACRVIAERGIEAVAVSFIHSYANASHEARALEIIREELPGIYACGSHEVLPEPPEFPRTSTTVANAYVGPVLRRYLSNLESAVKDVGFTGTVLVMHSGGGTMSPAQALKLPARTATSGPAAGVMAAADIASSMGRNKAVSLDMGGTSADIAAIRDGRPPVTVEQKVEWGLPIGFPSIDLIAIGAGGGSIAWVDDAGAPHVGPMSAGALPGPACYGRGGTLPTTMDANLVLGRMRDTSLLGGGMRLDLDLATRAIEDGFATRLGLKADGAALGILRIANEHMANGIRKVTIQRGLDPREFSLVAFGGAGPMHAAEVAQMMQIPEVIIPAHPGATSAWGLVTVDSRHDLVRSHIVDLEVADRGEIQGYFADMEADARQILEEEGFSADAIRLERTVDVRYVGQLRSLTLDVGSALDSDEGVQGLISAFHEAYEAEFKYAVRDHAIESRSLRVTATGLAERVTAGAVRTEGSVESAWVTSAPMCFEEKDGFVEAAFYNRTSLPVGSRIEGPAVIEQYDSTTVVPPRCTAEVHESGALVISIG